MIVCKFYIFARTVEDAGPYNHIRSHSKTAGSYDHIRSGSKTAGPYDHIQSIRFFTKKKTFSEEKA